MKMKPFSNTYVYLLEMGKDRITERAPHLTASSAHWLPFVGILLQCLRITSQI